MSKIKEKMITNRFIQLVETELLKRVIYAHLISVLKKFTAKKEEKDMDKPLTNKQYDFCMDYVRNNFNSRDAALKAGYSQSYAYSRAHELPNNPIIHKRLCEEYETASNKLGITFEWKAGKLKRIIEAFTAETKKSLAAQEVKVVIQAINTLNQMQGDLAPKKQLTVNVNATKERLAEAKRIYDEY